MNNPNSSRLLLVAIIISLLNTSCTKIFTSMYGMKTAKYLNEDEIYHHAKKYNLPAENCFQTDSSFLNFIFSLDTAKYAVQIQNHFQSLKVLYYNNVGFMQAFHVNCYTGGFPNLNWNKNGAFDVFLPKQQADLDSILPLSKHLSYIRPLSKAKAFSVSDYDYVVFVFWSRHMGRQSRRFIKIINRNVNLASDQKVKVLYINNDNIEAMVQ
jgi:hypothetical protein